MEIRWFAEYEMAGLLIADLQVARVAKSQSPRWQGLGFDDREGYSDLH